MSRDNWLPVDCTLPLSGQIANGEDLELAAQIARHWYGENDARQPFMQLMSARRVACNFPKDALKMVEVARKLLSGDTK